MPLLWPSLGNASEIVLLLFAPAADRESEVTVAQLIRALQEILEEDPDRGAWHVDTVGDSASWCDPGIEVYAEVAQQSIRSERDRVIVRRRLK